ncbi:asparagine synthase (glutamine-hydrolyzing) [Elioraea tepidiphila]|uniref:asparagine synthase (glutamine-hydrolyzing) n=1 Tax=Elioraea tepidiphila TaxID=457934 RepID=UPI00037388A9|nr:asparagine synthase (glutamine-hydrolyzing) [Elioraea tepidiphila]
MCGIAGIILKRGQPGAIDTGAIARRMADLMAHRGPDDAGVWVSPDGRVALSHRRLAIIDLSAAGHQPMTGRSGRTHIVFNGEIYNFRDLRARFEAEGVAFRSDSDTEVLLEALERDGAAALNSLDAMFAFAWYDEASGRLMLARDIFGEKPLYYTDNDTCFAFASELSALAEVPGFDDRVDGDTIARFLAYQYVPAPETIYRGARKLPPAHLLMREADGTFATRAHYRFVPDGPAEPARSLSEAADELEAILVGTVRQRLISDVPLGAFLSGGVDSSLVVALAARVLGQPVKTFTIGFAGFAESEHKDAAEVAGLLGTDHREQVLSPDSVGLCEQIGRVLDEPNADSSCLPTFLLSRFTREAVTVALSGDGGDELFGGYGRYMATVDEATEAARLRLPGFSPGAAYWSARLLVFPESELQALAGGVPAALVDEFATARAALDGDPRPLVHRLREADVRMYMPGAVLAKVDRMSMQSSLEVRAPLLGREVADFASRLAASECVRGGAGKHVLKEVARRYLPSAIIDRPKRGFGLPMGLWGAEALLPAARALLLSGPTCLAAWIPRDRLARYLDRMTRDFSAYRVWALLVLEFWLRTHRHSVGAPLATTAALSAPVAGRAANRLVRLLARGRRMVARFT